MKKVVVKKNRYVDSVSLMGVSERVTAMQGVENAEAQMATCANQDVLKMIDMLSGRLSRIHLKDYLDKPEGSDMIGVVHLRPIYEGKLPYDDYFAALKKVGCEHALVEQDHSYEEDSMDCLERSIKNIKARGIL